MSSSFLGFAPIFYIFLTYKGKGLFCGVLTKFFQTMRRPRGFRFPAHTAKKCSTRPCVPYLYIFAYIPLFMKDYAGYFSRKRRAFRTRSPAPRGRQKTTFLFIGNIIKKRPGEQNPPTFFKIQRKTPAGPAAAEKRFERQTPPCSAQWSMASLSDQSFWERST